MSLGASRVAPSIPLPADAVVDPRIGSSGPCLLALEDGLQADAARQVASKGLSVRETEALIRKISAPVKKPKTVRKDPDIIKLEERLTESLGAQVRIKQKAKGKGSLEIAYTSLDVLDGILSKIES